MGRGVILGEVLTPIFPEYLLNLSQVNDIRNNRIEVRVYKQAISKFLGQYSPGKLLGQTRARVSPFRSEQVLRVWVEGDTKACIFRVQGRKPAGVPST